MAPRGDGPAPKESLMGPGAIDQAGLPCPGAPLSWSGCGFDLGTTSDSKVPCNPRSDNAYYQTLTWSQIRRWSDRGDIDQDSLAFATRCRGWALGPPDQIQQLTLDRDQGPSGCNSVGSRGAGILGEVRHFNRAAPEPQSHRAGLHCPSQSNDHFPALRSPGQRFSINLRHPFFQCWHDVAIQKNTTISSP